MLFVETQLFLFVASKYSVLLMTETRLQKFASEIIRKSNAYDVVYLFVVRPPVNSTRIDNKI